jgi:hypothetical protein
LIQETVVSDSEIAHFWRPTAHWPSFATHSPQKRTFVGMSTMSALCQNGLTHCSNFLLLFDLPVGAANQRKRYARAECLSGFQMERLEEFLSTRASSLMRCNNRAL